MENKKVMVESLVSGSVSINLPDLKLKRIWERKGVQKPINFNDLQEAIYDPGVEYMFKEGILHIADLEVKKALGLEPDDVKEPVNIIILNDSQRKRLMTVAPIADFKETLETLSYEQKRALADYAIANEYTQIDKCDLLKAATGQDILQAIRLNRLNNEVEKEEENKK